MLIEFCWKRTDSWKIEINKYPDIYQEIDSAERLNCTIYEVGDDFLFHDVTDNAVDILRGQPDLGTLGEDFVEAALMDVNEGQFGAPLSHLLRRATTDLTTGTYTNEYIMYVLNNPNKYINHTASPKAMPISQLNIKNIIFSEANWHHEGIILILYRRSLDTFYTWFEPIANGPAAKKSHRMTDWSRWIYCYYAAHSIMR